MTCNSNVFLFNFYSFKLMAVFIDLIFSVYVRLDRDIIQRCLRRRRRGYSVGFGLETTASREANSF